jgi:hypothetical protein
MAKTNVLETDDVAKKTTPVRLSEEAMKWAKIASGYTGESMAEYVSRIVEERGKADVERLHSQVMGAETAQPKPKRGGSK